MKIDVWFDPGCPYTWVTTRWINRVAPERGLLISWRSFSLFVKNDPPESSPRFGKHDRARRLLRVVEAVRESGHEDRIGELYTEMGRRIHNRDDSQFDTASLLKGLDLDPELAEAIDDPAWDDAIDRSMGDALELVGDDVGVPIIALDTRSGRAGLSGPVLAALPERDDALALWDGLVLVAGTPEFWELERTRTGSPTPPPESALTP